MVSIDSAVDSIEQQLKTLEAGIKDVEAEDPECECLKELHRQYKWAESYLQKLKTLQASSCPTLKAMAVPNTTSQVADIISYRNISNLNASNWIYGDMTESEYYMNLFNITSCHNVTKCPI